MGALYMKKRTTLNGLCTYNRSLENSFPLASILFKSSIPSVSKYSVVCQDEILFVVKGSFKGENIDQAISI